VKRLWIWLGVILFLLAAAVCFNGFSQSIWLSETPNFPRRRAMNDLLIGGAGTVLCLGIATMLSISLYRSRQK
jgi:ABC-type Fe3+ transport system permease subunit